MVTRSSWQRRVLLPLIALVCPPLALALHGRLLLALVAGSVLAGLWGWSTPEVLPLTLLVWGLLALFTLARISGN